jgi:DNA polymerase elongation subunit (family B)
MIEQKKIDVFINGKDPQKRIFYIECGYGSKKAITYAKNDENAIEILEFDFYPFVWATEKGVKNLGIDKYGVYDRDEFKKRLDKAHIDFKRLRTTDDNGFEPERMKNGYKYMFYANKPMEFITFHAFFKESGQDLYGEERLFLCVNPVEQFMIHTGKRYFKEMNDYDDLLRFVWDIETQGLDPKRHRITQIGLRTNRELEQIIHVDLENPYGEITAIKEFFQYIGQINPDVICGHNSENFDWNFLMVRCEILGVDFEKITKNYTGEKIRKKDKQQVLKLGGEIEYFYPTVFPKHNIVDSLHAVRRAQAIDSNFKSANLKYAAQYAKVKKSNRVYVPGDKIATLYEDIVGHYLFDNENGEWFEMTKTRMSETIDGLERFYKKDHKWLDRSNSHILTVVNGRYISDRYLKDDLYEGDRVEYTYNLPNFFLCKLLPITYQKAITMGTSAGWKYMLLAWSYENNLAIPLTEKIYPFTGGLSRLWKTGFISNVVKYDFNSLYPAITLTWDIFPELDITGVFKALLDYILTTREKYKGMKKQAGKTVKKLIEENADIQEIMKWETEENKYDKLQLPFKIFGNGFFGSFGASNIFNFGSVPHAEEITCTGRMSLRLMTNWLLSKNFEPIVADTDGINFTYQNVDMSYKYVEKGLNRNTKEGVERTGLDAYCAEFNDLFMRGKMGLGIDEIIPASIYFSRKNYADLLDNGKIKLVGNSIKSKKMPKYIEKFIDNNLPLLLNKNGQQFLDNYYNYIEKICNGNIPLRDIASIGKIKTNIKDYLKDKEGRTTAGVLKSRQAWYELAIKDNIDVHMGDAIYYVNVGTKKNVGDVVKTPVYKTDENGEVVKQDALDKAGKPIFLKSGKVKQEKVIDHYEYVLNCVRIDNSIIEADKDYFGWEEEFKEVIKPNLDKYVEQFNKRIKGLLVCFHPDIRNNILITSTDDKKYYTAVQAQLVSGLPNKETDQDKLSDLFIPEDKEIKFWLSVNKTPPFVEELGWDWNAITNDYKQRMDEINRIGASEELSRYNEIVSKVKLDDIKEACENDSISSADFVKELEVFTYRDSEQNFISKQYNVKLGNLSDLFTQNVVDDLLIYG